MKSANLRIPKKKFFYFLTVILIIVSQNLEAQSECETLLNRKMDLSNEEKAFADLEKLDKCGLLPSGFYDFPFGTMMMSDSLKSQGVSYKQFFEMIVSSQEEMIKEKKHCNEIRDRIGDLSKWKDKDRIDMMSCRLSYFDALLIEDYLLGQQERINSLSYSEIRRKMSYEHGKILDYLYSDDFDIFNKDLNQDFDSTKNTIIYISEVNDDSEHLVVKMLEDIGITYKISRDFNFYSMSKDYFERAGGDEKLLDSARNNNNLQTEFYTINKEELDQMKLQGKILIFDRDKRIIENMALNNGNDFIEILEKY